MKWILFSTLAVASVKAGEANYLIQPATQSWHLFGRTVDYARNSEGEKLTIEKSSNTIDKTLTPLQFSSWKLYKDSNLSFNYPDSTRVSIKTKPGEISNYTLFLNDVPQFSIQFAKAEGFMKWDQRIRMPHMHLKTVDKSLAGYTYFPGGILNQLQISNDSAVASFILRTDPRRDTAQLTQATREKIAASIRLSGNDGKAADKWRTKIRKRLGWAGSTRFLSRGLHYNEVVELLGEPNDKQGNTKIWLRTAAGYPTSLKLLFDENDKLESLPAYGIVTDYSMPVRGDAAWINRTLNPSREARKSKPNNGWSLGTETTKRTRPPHKFKYKPASEFSDEIKSEIVSSSLNLLKTAKPHELNGATSAVLKAIMKLKLDPTPFAEVIAERNIPSLRAILILKRAKHPKLEAFVIKKLEELYARTWKLGFG